jgi:dTDP-glucose 4,6-dehydratase
LDKKPLYIFGSGRQKRDYMNIDDLIAAYLLVFENRKKLNGLAINFASGKSTSVGAIVRYVAKKMNAKVEKKPARPGEVRDFPADISLAKKIGFSPKVEIWAGIDRYIKWRLEEEE